jgi:hypothetical protein
MRRNGEKDKKQSGNNDRKRTTKGRMSEDREQSLTTDYTDFEKA